MRKETRRTREEKWRKNGEEKKRGYVWKDGKREKIGDRRSKEGYSEKDAVQMKEAQGRSPPFQEPL